MISPWHLTHQPFDYFQTSACSLGGWSTSWLCRIISAAIRRCFALSLDVISCGGRHAVRAQKSNMKSLLLDNSRGNSQFRTLKNCFDDLYQSRLPSYDKHCWKSKRSLRLYNSNLDPKTINGNKQGTVARNYTVISKPEGHVYWSLLDKLSD